MSWFKRKPASPQQAIERQLKEVEQQGAGLARLAHLTSFALVIAFSAGSLVALAGDAISHFISQWQRGVIDIPTLISFVVSLLLVVCMDVALFVAAGAVRMLKQRRQQGAGIHVAVIVGVSIVEAGTYLYMSWLYDHPATLAVWLLIAARSLAAPLTAVYLSLARVLPIGARDILYQVELVTARGVISDMTQIAKNPNAPSERKLALYQASSVMAPDDRQRLDGLIAAARVSSPAENIAASQIAEHLTAEHAMATVARELHLSDYPPAVENDTETVNNPSDDDHDDRPPSGPGSPTVASKLARQAASAVNVTPIRRGLGRPPRRDRQTASRANARSGKRGKAEEKVRAALASKPEASFEELVRQTRLSASTVSKWLEVIRREGRVATPSQTA